MLGACVVAALAGRISAAAEGLGQELFNAAVLLVAVAMLGWHQVWMSQHGRSMARQMSELGRSVQQGGQPLHVLAIVVGAAILREGSEVVLFLYGVVAANSDTGWDVALGGLAGLGLGALVTLLTYFGLVRIPTRALFTTTTILIALLAAGMAAQAAAFLEKANWLTALDNVVWDSSRLLSDASIPGKALHTLIGYTDQPTAMQLIVYVAILAVTFVLMRLYGAPVKAQPAAARG